MPTVRNMRTMHKELVTHILEGEGKASPAQRRAAFNNAGIAEPWSALVNNVAQSAYKVTDDDIAAAKAAGLGEDEIFEIVVSAAIGQATRQYETALAALDAVTTKE